MIEIKFYVPEDHLEQVKAAVFAAGAGQIGDYDCCAWQVLGEGQFRPLQGATPYIGRQDEIAKVREYRVEMVCQESTLKDVIVALKEAHPYEEPAYSALRLLDV